MQATCNPEPRTRKISTLSKIFKFPDFKPGLFGLCLCVFGSGAAWAADTNKGGQIYATHCALCHGASGISVMPNAPNFARGEGMLQPDPVIAASIRNGMNAMPAFQGILSDSDIMDVVVYLRTLN